MSKNKLGVELPKTWDIVYALYFETDVNINDVLDIRDIKIMPCTIDIVGANGVVLLKSNKKIDGRYYDLWYGMSDYQFRFFKLRSVAKVVRSMILHSWDSMKKHIDIPAVIHIKRQ